MIPKKIHYVWVGGHEKPAAIKRCMATWQQHLAGYEIIEWNEHNFDLTKNKYVREAYAAKKWAFVSDYIRAAVIEQYGGIYLDTDVLVLDDLTSLLNDRAFVGFENAQYPFTAAFGAEAHHPLAQKMLAEYDDARFTFDKGDQMAGVNTKSVSDILINDFHCVPNNQEQVLTDGIRVYPDTVLCNPSGQSHTIHVFTGSWMEGQKPLKRRINKWVKLRLTSKRRAALYQRVFR